MIDTFEAADDRDHRIALRASGLLAAANRAGALTAADVHVATAVGEASQETDERVLLAVALACAAVRGGSVCVDLAAVAADPLAAPEGGPEPPAWPAPEAWAGAVAASDAVTAGLVRWEHGLLYLDRYRELEQQLVDDLAERARRHPGVDAERLAASIARTLPGHGYAEQAAAVGTAARRTTTILTGGPGTGKTTTVAALLVALQEQAPPGGRRLRIALAAPTGKAAARLGESVHAQAHDLDEDDAAGLRGLEATTLHRLLRRLPDQHTRFRHHRTNRLPHDVVVVDEASMVSLTMMARLLEATRPEARLVLVGDPDQLASVEAGAVLTDLVAGFEAGGGRENPVARLTTSHRFEEGIGELAVALREGDADAVLGVLAAGHDDVVWVRDEDPRAAIRAAAEQPALDIRTAALAGDAEGAVVALEAHRLLCAHREGPWGVRRWNRQVEQWITDATGDPLLGPHPVGRPLLVTANDYGLEVYNGDAGVVVRGEDGPRVALGTGAGVRDLAPSRLPDVSTMHAMTIHKSQGSQARQVTVLLPDPDSRLLTRELFYTAVTRAQHVVRVVGDEAAVRAAVDRRVRRGSGLRQRLAGG